MGQSLSRRPSPKPTPTSAPAPVPVPEHTNATHPPRRSLSRRIFPSLPKPTLRSRPFSSTALPARPEQTLRGKKRRWGLSRRRNVPASVDGVVPERMDRLAEHDEHRDDRDVDEFGVITHRVPDSHNDSQATSAKGKEKAADIPDIEDDNGNEHGDDPVSSSSAAPLSTQPGTHVDHIDDDQVVIAPTAPPSPPSQSSPLPTLQEPERPLVPPSVPAPSPLSQSSAQQANTSPRPFPPPGTLVVVQGVVHTTDVPRPSERPVAASNPTPQATNDALDPNTSPSFETSSPRPSSLPPGTRSRNPLAGILPRPTSMVSTVPSSPPLDSVIDPLVVDPQIRQVTSDVSGVAEENRDEDRPHAHTHGISMPQGPVGTSGLSANSIDVLGTLLSVAAAATAASLLTGSSEPIFSSGLTSSQPPSSGSIPPAAGLNSNIPSERPLSPTPTSDARRMRHVWSSLRDRLGLGSGSGAHNSSHPSDTTPSSGAGQGVPSQLPDTAPSRDPREIMLAEMARAFNLGLGLGGAASNGPSAMTSANAPEGPISDDADAGAGDRAGEQPLLPPPDSFERFLMDLQTDLRITLMQEQDLGVLGGIPQDSDGPAEGVEDQPIPELQSLSDSDSEEFEVMGSDSGDEDEPDCREDADEDGDDLHITRERLSGRTSPAVSAFGAGIHPPFDIRTRLGSISSSHDSGASPPRTAPLQPVSAATSSSDDTRIGFATGNEIGDISAAHTSSATAFRTGAHVSANDSRPEIQSEEASEGLQEGAALGVAHSLGTSRGRRAEVEGGHAVSGVTAVSPRDTQDPSNVPGAETGQESFLTGVPSLPVLLTSSAPNSLPGGSVSNTQNPTQLPVLASPPSSDPERITESLPSTSPTPADPSMPLRLPFTPSSASRTERTPGGGINWWRMYRFPAVPSPNLGQPGGLPGSPPLSQSPFRTPAQGPGHTSTSPWPRQNQQNEMITPGGVAEVPAVHSGLAAPAPTSSATTANMPGLVSTSNESSSAPLPTNGQDSNPSTTTTSTFSPLEHRSNVVVPVIVVGLQSVNMDRQPPNAPQPHIHHTPAIDDEDGEGMDFDGDQSMSTPLHIPEPAEFRHHSSSSSSTTQQEQGNQPAARGRTWQSRAANAIRNLRSSRRNADATSPQPQETPGSRTFLIYVIGGYYPPDHQIITGGNLDSFEALWELAELLGQVKPPTVSKEEIERSGLEIIRASVLEEYQNQGRVASNCIDRCLICLDDYTPDDELRLLTCKHAFHQGCVDRWLETGRNNCPACRTKGVVNQDA